jgi:pyrimidine operon attenuation protein/uracil phosphoribosyltransferase
MIPIIKFFAVMVTMFLNDLSHETLKKEPVKKDFYKEKINKTKVILIDKKKTMVCNKLTTV